MLCQQCGKNQATTFIKKNINGHITEQHLCQSCAAKQGLGSPLGWFQLGGVDFGLDNFWGSLFAEPTVRAVPAAAEQRCTFCGRTFSQLAQTGKAGCATCYATFYDRLLPSLQRIHGQTRHVGKQPGKPTVPVTLSGKSDVQSKIAALKKQLNQCIERQEYEQCARLRDEIRQLQQLEEKGE